MTNWLCVHVIAQIDHYYCNSIIMRATGCGDNERATHIVNLYGSHLNSTEAD